MSDSVANTVKRLDAENKSLKDMIMKLEDTVISKYDEIITILNHKNSIVEELFNKVETKLDIYSNIEYSAPATGSAAASSAKKSTTKITSLAFLKKELTDDLLKFVDVLYTNADIERINENSEVKKKKSESEIKNKIISILHGEIKKDTPRFKQLEELKDTYIQSLKNDELIE